MRAASVGRSPRLYHGTVLSVWNTASRSGRTIMRASHLQKLKEAQRLPRLPPSKSTPCRIHPRGPAAWPPPRGGRRRADSGRGSAAGDPHEDHRRGFPPGGS
eukprot:722292-Hanusia_phi.AAC.1